MSFGPYARFGAIINEFRDAKLTYEPSEMVGTRRRGIMGISSKKVWSISTNYVERRHFRRWPTGQRSASCHGAPKRACRFMLKLLCTKGNLDGLQFCCRLIVPVDQIIL
jgi:hypothetical protein